MKTAKKAIILAICAVLLVVSTVFATVAFLTDNDTVTNTFTFGKVGITLDEAKVNSDGSVTENAERVKANEYHLIPGHTYTKDPTVTVDADSEDCWLFVKIDNELAAILDTVALDAQIAANGWVALDGADGVYYNTVIASANDTFDVFESITVKDDADVSQYGQSTIEVTAYAVQADGFDTASEAWTAANFS